MDARDMEVSSSGLSNDARGMIMSIVSASACILGASVICVDIFTAHIPRWKHFRIQDSDSFLASSLSLSFGVMIFSSLYNILPSSRKYLEEDGYADCNAGLVMIICFGLGAIGIGIISRFIHQFMPSHVVDCDHEHSDRVDSDCQSLISQEHPHKSHRSLSQSPIIASTSVDSEVVNEQPIRSLADCIPNERTPLLVSAVPKSSRSMSAPGIPALPVESGVVEITKATGTGRELPGVSHKLSRQSSVKRMQEQVISFIADTKLNCDASGPCYGYRDPCGNTCFKVRAIQPRTTGNKRRRTSFIRTNSGMLRMKRSRQYNAGRPIDTHARHRAGSYGEQSLSRIYGSSPKFSSGRCHDSSIISTGSPEISTPAEYAHNHDDHHDHNTPAHDSTIRSPHSNMTLPSPAPIADVEAQASPTSHHHHVSSRPFLSIGLQTSIAIGLHKLPEGFITYASNHANPELGFAVFLALLVHNIAEGFSLALPLYLALGSRTKAIVWSALLGGLSQPIGAGVAAIWFSVVSTAPSEGVYGMLFAVTAGIMVGVGLQLFSEGLALRHDKDKCVWFAFCGMAVMGLSGVVSSH